MPRPGQALTVADWGAVAVTHAHGFHEANAVLELGAGDHSRSIALAERYPAKHFLSTDYTLSDRATANLAAIDALANVEVATVDARTVELPAESVDFVFSIALMEHIAELEACLEAVHRVLRPGGVYFYVQAPFWTCAQGHHFRHSDDRTYDFIPKYAHLTHDENELAAVLRAGPPPPFDIDACVASIYGRPDLSRLGLDATKRIVESGPLALAAWSEKADTRYDEQAARTTFPRLRTPARFEELAVSGASVRLHRPPEGRRARWWRHARQSMSTKRNPR